MLNVATKKPKNVWAAKIAQLKQKLRLRTDQDVADRLGVSRETIRSWKYRGGEPPLLAQKYINDLLKD